MEVVSTSNLVSSENKQTNKKKTINNSLQVSNRGYELFCYTACFDESPNGNLSIYAKMKLFVVSWWQNCEIVP